MKSKTNSPTFFFLMIAVLITVSSCRQENRLCDCPPSKFEGGIYYSQTYEDYILAYVFKNVDRGFYIDVGANDPNVFNVTRFFYERGWRGINIEPNVELFKRIVQFRPRDLNYNCGISNTEGNLNFYQETNELDDFMPMSTFDKTIAEGQRKKHGLHFTETRVPVTTLNKLLAKISIPEITFISIDVEGFEKQVIESIDLARYKPVVLCVEATDPVAGNPSYMKWEKLVMDNNYVFAMSDGLNRYYLHKSHIELLPRFIDIDRCVKLSKYKRQVKMDGWSLW
jgi:FkbM family methyltransferase